MGKKLDAWLDERQAWMFVPGTDQLKTDIYRPEKDPQDLYDEFRAALTNSYQGRCLAVEDAFDELFTAVLDGLHIPKRWRNDH